MVKQFKLVCDNRLEVRGQLFNQKVEVAILRGWATDKKRLDPRCD